MLTGCRKHRLESYYSGSIVADAVVVSYTEAAHTAISTTEYDATPPNSELSKHVTHRTEGCELASTRRLDLDISHVA